MAHRLISDLAAVWQSVHGGTSAGGLRPFGFVQHNVDLDDGVIDLPQFPVLGDSDGEVMPELFFSDSDEEDIHAPPGPAAAAGGFANPGHQD